MNCRLIGMVTFLLVSSVSATSESEEDFVRAAIDKIHSSLRLAVFMSDYQLACLTDDRQWFAQNTTRPVLYRRETCLHRIDSLKEEIKRKYPIMISMLTIYHYRDISWIADSLEKGQEEDVRFSHVQQRRMVRHLFPGLVKLPPVSMHQLKEATKLLQQKIFCQGVDLRCYEREYKALLVGRENHIPGLPILGFVTSATPERDELIRGIREIRKNTLELLEDFRQKYFMTENGGYRLKKLFAKHRKNPRMPVRARDSLLETHLDLFEFAGLLNNSLAKESEKFQTLFEQGFTAWQSREGDRIWTELGFVFAWMGGCMVILRSPLARRLCTIPTGIGANLYFFSTDTQRYQKAIDIAFYRADDGSPTYQDVSMLDELAFARNISALMLPFFTEIPGLLKVVPRMGNRVKVLRGSVSKRNYKFWDTNKSSTRYQILLEHTVKHPHFLRMGAAVIDDNLIRHQHRESEIYYFLKGKGVSYLGRPGKEIAVPVEKGTFLYIPSGVHHYTKADADNPLEFIFVFPRRNANKDIEYVFDGRLESFDGGILVGNVPETLDTFHGVRRESLIGGEGVDLLFERVSVSHQRRFSHDAVNNTIIFVNEGQGMITVGSQEFSVGKGSYLLVPKERRYTVENRTSRGLDLLLFENAFR